MVWDVAIAGGGATGLTLALVLRRLSGGLLRVVIIDRADPAVRTGPRTSALAEGPRRMLERAGVWDRLADRAQPIWRMDISDARLADAVRSALLTFEATEAGSPLAHMLFHRDLEPQLLASAAQEGVEIISDIIDDVSLTGGAASVTTRMSGLVRARLLVGADGLRSRTRTAARIPLTTWPYNRSALVFTVRHEREHEGVAVQHFFENGPFASLPLTGRRSSIVWTEQTSTAELCLALSPTEMAREVEYRLGGSFGDVELEDRPQSFPLVFQLAREFVGNRLALVGDAAHRVHPLAGQGLNIGMRDVATLAALVIGACRLGGDPGSTEILKEYERRRRFDAVTSAVAFDFLHKQYSSDIPFLRTGRRFAMGAVNNMRDIKSALTREANGISGAYPALFR
jgi:2-octaprenyl-6-methoxyphenol hydroxylase